jgi:hypothetical protein
MRLVILGIGLASLFPITQVRADCDAVLHAQYDKLQLTDEHHTSSELKAWYSSAEFKERFKKRAFAGGVGFGRFKLKADASDDEINKFQQDVANSTEESINEEQKLDFLQTKGLGSIVAAWMACKDLENTTSLVKADAVSSGPEVVITVHYTPVGNAEPATVQGEPIVLGLNPTGPQISSGAKLSNGAPVQAKFEVIPGYPSPYFTLTTDRGTARVPVSPYTPVDVQALISELNSVKQSKATLESNLNARTAELAAAKGDLAKANALIAKSGVPVKAGDGAAIWLPCGNKRIWVRDAGWNPSGLSVGNDPSVIGLDLLAPSPHQHPVIVSAPGAPHY